MTSSKEVRLMLGNWNMQFPDCEPVAHLLREAFPSRWVRFHGLPGSKRLNIRSE